MNTFPSSQSFSTQWALLFAISAFGAIILMPDSAAAYDNTSLDVALCELVGWMTGKTGKALATLGIIIVGVGALMGKVSWGMAIIVALGIALIFGAKGLATTLGAYGENCTTGNPLN